MTTAENRGLPDLPHGITSNAVYGDACELPLSNLWPLSLNNNPGLAQRECAYRCAIWSSSAPTVQLFCRYKIHPRFLQMVTETHNAHTRPFHIFDNPLCDCNMCAPSSYTRCLPTSYDTPLSTLRGSCDYLLLWILTTRSACAPHNCSTITSFGQRSDLLPISDVMYVDCSCLLHRSHLWYLPIVCVG